MPNVFNGGSGLTGIVKNDVPINDGFLTDPNYDFSSWTEPVLNTRFPLVPEYVAFQNTYGSDFWTHEDTTFATNSPSSWYKVPLPFC